MVSNIIIKDISTPSQIVKIALDSAKNTVLGTIKAEKAAFKSYSKTKFPRFYTAEQGQFSTKALPHVYVSDLFVSSNARKQGIGKKLIFDVIKESKQQGCEGRIILNAYCKESSPLVFYKKLGFITTNNKLNKQLDEAIKYGTTIYQDSQVYMTLPQKIIAKILKQK